MRITIETIPHAEQRYDTVGDWEHQRSVTSDHLRIRVSKLGDWRKEMCIAIHELTEALICIHQNIPQVDVDYFDMRGPGAALDEPGDDPRAPYHKAHMLAGVPEALLMAALDITPDEYEKAIDSVSGEHT